MHVITLGNLEQFNVEIPPPAVVRLQLTDDNRTAGRGDSNCVLPRLSCRLDLQAVNPYGDLIWLHTGYAVQRLAGGQFVTDQDRSRYLQMPHMHDAVKAHLEATGYTVRPGQFALPDNLKPLPGVFECVRWVADAYTGELTLLADNSLPEEVG